MEEGIIRYGCGTLVVKRQHTCPTAARLLASLRERDGYGRRIQSSRAASGCSLAGVAIIPAVQALLVVARGIPRNEPSRIIMRSSRGPARCTDPASAAFTTVSTRPGHRRCGDRDGRRGIWRWWLAGLCSVLSGHSFDIRGRSQVGAAHPFVCASGTSSNPVPCSDHERRQEPEF
jgi:hypothetical protein